MNTEMEMTVIILWLAGVVCGTGFFVGLASFLWNWRKKHKKCLIYSFFATLVGFAGMSNCIFSLLRLLRAWI